MIKYLLYEFEKNLISWLSYSISAFLFMFLIYNTPDGTIFFISGIFITGLIILTIFKVMAIISADMYNDEQYFVYTLPIRKSYILFSKYIYAMFFALSVQAGLILGGLLFDFPRQEFLPIREIIVLDAIAISIITLVYVLLKVTGKSRKMATIIIYTVYTLVGYILYDYIITDFIMNSMIGTFSTSIILLVISMYVIDEYYEA